MSVKQNKAKVDLLPGGRRKLAASLFEKRRSNSPMKNIQSVQNLRKTELRTIFTKSEQNFKSLSIKQGLNRAAKDSKERKESKDENKENGKKQKLVIPKNMISFQPKANLET